jgi:hypothetical protein
MVGKRYPTTWEAQYAQCKHYECETGLQNPSACRKDHSSRDGQKLNSTIGCLLGRDRAAARDPDHSELGNFWRIDSQTALTFSVSV